MATFEVSPIDLAVVLLYIILSRVLVIWMTRGSSETSDGFFLGGKSFTWPMIAFSLFATNVSGGSFVGLAGAGYSGGIAVYSYEWMAAVILVIFITFMLPFYLRANVFTMPEFLERRFDRRSRHIFAAMLIFLEGGILLSGGLYVGAVIIQMLYPDLPLWIGCVIIMILSAALSMTGGLKAVVLSDTIQSIVLLIGGTIVMIAAYNALDSWESVYSQVPDDYMHIIQPADSDSVPWPGLFTGLLIIGLYFWTTNQTMVQRVLGAKDLNHGRWGALAAGALKLPILFLMIMPGVIAVALYPDLPAPDYAYPTLVFDLLPVGVRGIVLAALLAAMTSSIDSILNSVSSIYTLDFVKTRHPDIDDRRLVFHGRLAVGVATVFAILWAPQIANFESLWSYVQSVFSYIVPPVVAIFFAGLLWKRATPDAAFYTFVISLIIGIAGFLLIQIGGLVDIHFLYAGFIIFLISCTLMIGISLVTQPRPEAEIGNMIWSTQYLKEETEELKGVPLWQNYRVLSVLLLLTTATIVYIYR
ncbi:sodium:solute symporter [Paracoccus tegillarcae]|uniref:Sodium:solute symporter n=1 Tax=Paracoccus tegillarcae TaxID=1529068 RepID=A0A2K9EH86_9RHOB|nr:sodium:solute symporter [Paracoccus tegillarcae]AUH34320.1 sodium:solute symporter [Paracoccus tegillarcae]